MMNSNPRGLAPNTGLSAGKAARYAAKLKREADAKAAFLLAKGTTVGKVTTIPRPETAEDTKLVLETLNRLGFTQRQTGPQSIVVFNNGRPVKLAA